MVVLPRADTCLNNQAAEMAVSSRAAAQLARTWKAVSHNYKAAELALLQQAHKDATTRPLRRR
jgi:hypothetical protein